MDPNRLFSPVAHILPPMSTAYPTTSPHSNLPFLQFYPFFMDYRFPVLFATIYVVSVSILNPTSNNVSRVVAMQKGLKPSLVKKSSYSMTTFVFLHNLLLFIFSLATFVNVTPALVKNYSTHNFTDAYCDRDGSFWDNALGYWGYLFYLSKFFNSFIHTIMYAYYALTCIGINPPGKKYLTSMQITQFLIGTTIAFSYLFFDNCLTNDGTVLATWINLVYLLPLTYLFVDFAKNTYSKK
ncbi:13512_t:CDS:2, partial [Cetraspora pellucida]